MKKDESDAKNILDRLGKLSVFLKNLDADAGNDECFNYPLEIIQKTMMFDVSVLYKVSNIIEDRLILEVVKVLDPKNSRLDLKENRKLRLFIDARDKRYVNEVNAFLNKNVSCINVPGMGCDVMGYVFFPKDCGGAYLFGGDFFGKEASVKDFEVSTVEIMCNFLSTILLKTQLKQKAEYDGLTGLYNAGKIKEELGILLKRLERKPEISASIAMGDIDFFKKINDNYGHIQGDIILREVGKILSMSMREYFDMAGRYGGEEFLLILDEIEGDKAVQVVERIREKIETTRFAQVDKSGKIIENQFLNITMSFGVAHLNNGMNNGLNKGAGDFSILTNHIGKADNALYSSKQSGRNKTTLFKETN
ncbi:MAG: GGDEF domain-containing protein [Desulfobacteraceae bacterium]|nr:GGDEF domain-containing protein [Desulfobacteraceae bacterium]